MNNKITNDITSVGILNPNLRVFDIVMSTDYGTSYNSYIVKGSEKIALIDCCHKTYFHHYLNNIKEVCNPEDIEYMVLNHNEPDHTGCIAQLLPLMPKVKIVTSQAGALYVRNITNNKDVEIIIVKDGDELSLGNKTLHFINAPFLHWPDSMFTWVKEEKTLFSCDFFGAHYCEPQVLDTNIVYQDKYEDALRYYYDAIFSPFAPYVQKGLAKMKDLEIDFICTSHGPVITKKGRLSYVKDAYTRWSIPHKNEKTTIPVFYCSAYGNTELLAKAIREGILEVLNADCQTYDIIEYNMKEMQHKLNISDAFAIGSPTINRDAVPPIWELLSHMDAINNQKKPALVFGSYGWSGEAVPNVRQRLESLRLKLFGDGFKVVFVPTEEDLATAKELGRAFAQSL